MLTRWALHGDGRTIADGEIVRPDERLAWPVTIGLGMQHVVAMFGATFLVPLLTGFPPTATLFFSGVGTIVFLLVTGNRLPSYLGSSFAFIAPITAATATDGRGGALFGVLVVGLLLAAVGALVVVTGTGWIDALMPPVVSGAIVALIGLNLAPAAKSNAAQAPVVALITLAAVIVWTVAFSGLVARLSIFGGVAVGYVAAVVGGQVDFAPVRDAAWVGLPDLASPSVSWSVLPAFVPVVLVLVAENVGHVRSVAHLADPALNRLTGRALLADGLATTVAGLGGGSGTTTYGENIGVMAATKVYSTAAYWVAAGFAVALGFLPKVGALVDTVPPGVLGGATTALYGLIAVVGIKIWIDNGVDFSRPVNQFTAATALVVGVADYTVRLGDLAFNGIALGTVAAIVVFHVMRTAGRLRQDTPGRGETSVGSRP